MALHIPCDRCHEELIQKPAIILGPPFQIDGYEVCEKYYLCVKCYDWLVKVTVMENPKEDKLTNESNLG